MNIRAIGNIAQGFDAGHSRMKNLWPPAAVLVFAFGAAVSAQDVSAQDVSAQGTAQGLLTQDATVDRAANGQPGKDIQVGVFLNVRADCTSGPLPGIKLTTRPQHGAVTVTKGKVTATNYKQCLALEVPAFVAYYRSKPDFSGVDVMTLEVKYPEGRTEIQRISVTVGSGTPGQRT
jgi:hypothetical protein